MSYLLTQRPITPETQVIAVEGELDMAAAPELQATVDRLIDGGITTLILNLNEVTFVDSAAVGVVMYTAKRMRQEAGALEIVCGEPNVLRIFEIVGLDRQLSISPSMPG
jgi:anti-sigma B factor antagonist